MSKDTLFYLIQDTIIKKGITFDAGCTVETSQMYRHRAYQLAPNKGVCSISGWMWLDFTNELNETAKESDTPACIQGLQCSFLISDYVIEDDSQRFKEGAWVRTSLLKNFHENCIFETKNTCYLLVGSGYRAKISLSEAVKFFVT